MKARHLLIPLFIFFAFTARSQFNIIDSLKIDSLKKSLSGLKDDTIKVNALNNLSGMLTHHRDEAKEYANSGLLLAQKLNFKNGEGMAYYHLALAECGLNYYGKRGDINKVLEYFDKALQIFETNGNEKEKADCYYEMSNAYSNLQQNFPDALQMMFKALNIYEKLDDKIKMGVCYMNLGIYYYKDNNKEEGSKLLETSLKIFTEIKDSSKMAYTNNTIGRSFLSERKYEKAIEYFNVALTIYRNLGNRGPDYGIDWTNGNIGDVYLAEGNDAIVSGNKALAEGKLKQALIIFTERLAIETERKLSHRDTYLELGGCNLSLSKISVGKDQLMRLSESQKYYNMALELGTATNNKVLLMNAYSNLVELNDISGNYKDAYENYRWFIIYRDSISNEETVKKSTQAKMQYEFDKKESVAKVVQEKKDADAKRTKNFQYVAIGAILLVAIFLYINSRQKQKAKTKIEKAYSELKLTQTQLIQSEKMASLGELTAGIAHEIQNPLNFVNNFSELNKELLAEMKAEIEKGNTADAMLIANDVIDNEEKINHHGKRADGIVKGMLQHSRTGSGQKELTDINDLADEYLRLAYHGLKAKDKSFNANFKTDLDRSLGRINIIPQEIGRVVLNLINNAFYAVSEKQKENIAAYEPTVIITTKKIANKVELRVIDNGNGVPKKVLDKIFQPFFTTKPTGVGTGLGLSLSYDIITKGHGGTLKVETKEGEGSQFIIQLPLSL